VFATTLLTSPASGMTFFKQAVTLQIPSGTVGKNFPFDLRMLVHGSSRSSNEACSSRSSGATRGACSKRFSRSNGSNRFSAWRHADNPIWVATVAF
jgi:hypothetical protein